MDIFLLFVLYLLSHSVIIAYAQINPALSSLHFEGGSISADGASRICSVLPALSTAESSIRAVPRIRKLDFSHNDIGDAGAEPCAELIRASTWMQELRLANCELSHQGVASLISALRDSSCIEILDLGQNSDIGLDGHVAIGAFLACDSSLQTLHLDYTGICIDGFKAVCDGLKVNRSLQEIVLEPMEPDGAVNLLADALRENSSLRRLHLSYSSIDEHSIEVLSAALRVNSGLELLDLDFNRIGDRGAISLGEALRVNTGLRTLILSECGIDDTGAVALGMALSRNSSLTCLKLNNNSIGDAGALSLGEALRANSAMITLDLECNQIGPLGAEFIRKAQLANSRLEPISLKFNRCDK